MRRAARGLRNSLGRRATSSSSSANTAAAAAAAASASAYSLSATGRGFDTELPDLILVVADAGQLVEADAALTASKVSPESTAIVQRSELRLDAFHENFSRAEPAGGWQTGKLYKMLYATGRYVDARRYADAYNVARVNETLTVLTDLGAQTILIKQDAHDARESSDAANLSLQLPTAEAVPAAVSAEFSVDESSSRDNARTISLEREAPAFKPHVKLPYPWFYRRGAGLCDAVVINEMIEKKREPNGQSLSITFSHTLSDTHLEAASVGLGEIIGLGRTTSTNTEHGANTTIEVTFFSREDFRRVQEYQPPRARRVRLSRLSLSGLAAHRNAFLKRSDLYREDVMFDLGQGLEVPVECVTMEQAVGSMGVEAPTAAAADPGSADAAAAETLAQAALMQAQVLQPGRVLTIPFTLYGPRGAGKSSVLFTLDQAVNGNAQAFIREGGLDWAHYSSPAREMSTFLKDVHFDPNLDKGKRNVVGVDRGLYAELHDKNVARLVFHDTKPAVSAYKDFRGRPLPFGMRVLVLKLEDIAAAYDARHDEAPADGSRGPFMNMCTSVMSMLGPPNGGDMRNGTIHRYPPFAVVLASHAPLVDARGRVVEPVDLYEEHGDLLRWFSGYFHVNYVFPMQTLAPLSDALRERIRHSRSAQADYIVVWEKVAEHSLVVLNEIFIAIADHEHLSASHLLESLEAAQRETSSRGGNVAARLVGWFKDKFLGAS